MFEALTLAADSEDDGTIGDWTSSGGRPPMTGQLAMTIDLIPDFIPVLGYADDAIIVAIALRSVARQTGIDELHCHWPGTEDGFAALCRLPGFVLPRKGSCPEPDAPRVIAVDLLVRSSRVLLVPVLRRHRLIARHQTTS